MIIELLNFWEVLCHIWAKINIFTRQSEYSMVAEPSNP